jgi:antitoxin (DNA-binding transcriptional repressor) of toxin-antitoxin stability system
MVSQTPDAPSSETPVGRNGTSFTSGPIDNVVTQGSLREAQVGLVDLVAHVEAGETILMTRPGGPPVHLGPVQPHEGEALPSLHRCRDSLEVNGGSLSETVRQQRDEDRC